MNRKKFNLSLLLVWMLACSVGWSASSARIFVGEGNGLYAQGNFNEALNRYDQALTENPQAVQAKFNKANCYLRLEDIDQAKNLYREVAVESRDMSLVEKAKYNLGNTLFQEGLKQQDSDLQKSIEGLKDAIVQWQATLELNESNSKAGKNIEVARLMIKDLMDQLKNQQQHPNQPQDPNQSQDPQQQNQQRDQTAQDPNQAQNQQPSDADPNEPDPSQDPNQPQPSPQQEDPNQSQEPQPQPEDARDMEQDMTAQRILDKEQRQNRERQQRRRVQNRKVKRDW